MQRLLSKHHFADIDRALRFLSIRLGSRPATAALTHDVNNARTAVRDTEDKYQAALQSRVAGTAEIDYLDSRLDALVMTIARDLLATTQGNRHDPRYLKLFATAPSTAMAPVGGEAQDTYVRSILTRLLEDSELVAVKHHANALTEARAALADATEKRRGLAVTEATTGADKQLALENARRVYNRMDAQLRLLLDDKALVESYFIVLNAKPKQDDVEADEPS